jgi:hypothetical protein
LRNIILLASHYFLDDGDHLTKARSSLLSAYISVNF